MRFLRYACYVLVVALSGLFFFLGFQHSDYWWPLSVLLPLSALGTWDLLQTRHSVLRNYPILAHLRFVFEGLRPELRQYFFESNLSGKPFSREQRTLIYTRAKNVEDKKPFGTELDVNADGYGWLSDCPPQYPLDPTLHPAPGAYTGAAAH